MESNISQTNQQITNLSKGMKIHFSNFLMENIKDTEPLMGFVKQSFTELSVDKNKLINLTKKNFEDIINNENFSLWLIWFNKKGDRAKEYKIWFINTISILNELNCNLLNFEIKDVVCDISKIYKKLLILK
jgi:hypothetical protein